MSTSEQMQLDAILRTNLSSFVQRCFHEVAASQRYLANWHVDAMAWHLQQCAAGKINRLLITVPPRYLKSICASVAYPAWLLGHDPSRRIICLSYAEKLAEKHSLDCRNVMRSAWYKRIFPGARISPEKNTELHFKTTAGGGRLSTSVGGTLTGLGGNLIIIDDPLKPDEARSESRRNAVNDWFGRTVYSRLDNKSEDVIIIVMQRLHLDDLVGYVQRHEEWVHLNLPAIAEAQQEVAVSKTLVYVRRPGDLLHPERESRVVLDAARVRLGSFDFSAQYQQNPLPLEGNLVKWSWFRYFETRPPAEYGDEIVQSWDTASKSEEIHDYSVCTTWLKKGNDYYLFDVLRKRLLYPDLKRKIVEMSQQHGATVILIENKGSGISLVQELSYEGCCPRPIPQEPEGDKVTRMSAQTAKLEAGQVHLPKDAPWLGAFQAEFLQFPRGKHDDQVDSVSQFLAWIKNRSGSFACDWLDDRSEGADGLVSRPVDVPPAAPTAKPNVMYSLPRNGGKVLLTEEEYFKLIRDESPHNLWVANC